MKRIKKLKTIISYLLVIILLSSTMVFPDYVHGRNDSMDMVAIKSESQKG